MSADMSVEIIGTDDGTGDGGIRIADAKDRRSLFQLANEYRAFVDELLDNEDGEINDDAEQQLDAISHTIETKLENCYRVLRQLESHASVAKEELDRIKRLHEVRERRAVWMKAYILQAMLVAGMKKFEGRACVLRVQKNSRPAISLDPTAEIPEGYERTKIEFDGTKAYEDWKRGGKLPATIRVVEGHHLRTGVGK